jgi:hypothetical protein
MQKLNYKSFLSILLPIIFISCSESIVESTRSIDEDETPIDVVSKFSDIQNSVFNQSCAFSGCHSSGSVNPDLSGSAYSNIVNKQSSVGLDYIEPNDPDNSYLLQKIIGSSSISGSRMPLNNPPLSQSQIDSIIEWINDGAKNN